MVVVAMAGLIGEMMATKSTAKAKMMANKTTSKIPKTAKQKQMWIKARQLSAKESGKYGEKSVPWGLVNHIYQAEKKANKVIKSSDIAKAKKSKAASKYKNK